MIGIITLIIVIASSKSVDKVFKERILDVQKDLEASQENLRILQTIKKKDN
jgi:ABC-type lipoprotein release transport system permease subunit